MEESWSSSFGSSAPARDDMRMARGLCPSRGDREQRAKQRVGRLSASSATTSASDRAPEHVAYAPQGRLGSHGECLLPACDEDCLRQAARACEGLRRWLLEICARSQLPADSSVTPLLLPQSHDSHPRLNRWSWALLPRSACSPVSASSVRRRSLPSPACLESLLSPYVCLVHSSSCALPSCPRVPACLMRSFRPRSPVPVNRADPSYNSSSSSVLRVTTVCLLNCDHSSLTLPGLAIG